MITEDYVSFETAKLLREKGFNEQCYAYYNIFYDNDGKELKLWRKYPHRAQPNTNYLNVPTLQTAMKWLREVHSQIIVPSIRVEDPISGIINCYIVGIWYIPKNNGGAFCYTSPTPYNGYSSFEEACEAAIKYCLENLI